MIQLLPQLEGKPMLALLALCAALPACLGLRAPPPPSRAPRPSLRSRREALSLPVLSSLSSLSALSALSALSLSPAAAWASSSRTAGYAVQRPESEWAALLSAQQYFVLREGGTEPPRSSPLLREKRSGTFACAACGAPLFSSRDKFDSGTGWPSFGGALAGVQFDGAPLRAALLGAECRCAACGGHLGDLFLDGFLFPGTPAFASGKRFCIDGAALVFTPSDGGAPVVGDSPPPAPQEMPAWLTPPKVG
ncbi:hypothetical protein AB1Y20_007728 [Prymnesium parvum]|uniref:MsrB domain-containing protein n=1 Tax=Prymnesium parvum TaxID=97485 RepID=A0AB34IVW2_PRYPA